MYSTNFKHLQNNNISYFYHMKNSLYYSFQSLKAGVIFAVHSIYPDIFQYTGSEVISKLNQQIWEDKIV